MRRKKNEIDDITTRFKLLNASATTWRLMPIALSNMTKVGRYRRLEFLHAKNRR
ncbi:predicted protein [Botrytis cinerea T4]|uniref:Uncharacterized protein n=1 Tax=Botryotinia fuckeliana (strain T4) TaxID=999810 RepID=G2YEV7_BOTF4|nr:predicted protein [Botrytis cinerea T4]